MDDEKDPQLELIMEKNREALNRLRSLTEDLVAVVEYEKRVVDNWVKPANHPSIEDEAGT